jgi:AraC family transcriptional regulator
VIHFARMFRRHTGASLHRHLLRLRLRAALERIVATLDDLAAVALDVGFASHSHFTDAFRREFGRAPSEVRRASLPRPRSG